jgi:excisionase family DNA binding protein
MDAERLLRYEEVAKRLGVAEITLRRWVSNEQIPYTKLGRAVRFRQSDIDAWIAHNTHAGGR